MDGGCDLSKADDLHALYDVLTDKIDPASGKFIGLTKFIWTFMVEPWKIIP